MNRKTIWVHSGGSCPACSAMKGTEYDENPGDVSMHPNCGCTADPVEIETEEEDLEFDATGRMIDPEESEERKTKKRYGKTATIEDIKEMKNNFGFHSAVAKTSAFKGGFNDLKNKEKLALFEKFKNTLGKDKYEKEKNFNEKIKMDIILNKLGQAKGAVIDLWKNYNQLRKVTEDQNLKGADDYYHLKANIQASQRGVVAEKTARNIGQFREFFDFYKNILFKGVSIEEAAKDAIKDLQINEKGLKIGRKNPHKDVGELAKEKRPKSLKKKYW